jgi:DNA repair protein RecN (Recombination protein N)
MALKARRARRRRPWSAPPARWTALIEFNEAEEALSDAAARFDVEPGRLNEVEERLFALRAAARKHNVEVDALAELRDRLAAVST